MQSPALIRYRIHQLEKEIMLEDDVSEARRRIAKLEEQFEVALRRELKRLAGLLTYKADIYGPNGRIYSHTAKWTVGWLNCKPSLFHGSLAIDHTKLFDGHGELITDGSSL